MPAVVIFIASRLFFGNMVTMFKAVIFDFDGVIADSEQLHFKAFNAILADYDFVISSDDYFEKYLGLSDFDAFTLFREKGLLGPDPESVGSLISRKNTVFSDLVASGGLIIDGVAEFLKMLSANNIAMGICSGALLCEIKLILESSDIGSYFETIVSADMVKKSKPDPEGFLVALQKLNNSKRSLAASECIVIEDAHWGLIAAAAAGMHTLAVTNSYSAAELSGADIIVDRLDKVTFSQLAKLCQ